MIIKSIKNPYIHAVISGVLCILSFPPFNYSLLIWFGLVPLIYSLITIQFKKKKFYGISYYEAPLVGLTFGVVFYYGTLHWMYNIFNLFGLLLLFVLCIYPFFFGYLLNYSCHKFEKKWGVLLLPLIFWTAIEFLKSEGWWLKFSWMNLGYSQHNFLPVLQLANLFGQYGITALIIFVNSLIVYALINRSRTKAVIKSGLTLIFIALLIVSYGIIELGDEYTPDVEVALVQDESSDFSKYQKLISRIDKKVSFILLPEYSLPEYLDENYYLLDRVRNITSVHDSYLIVGSKDRADNFDGYGYYNTAFIFNPQGDIVGGYYKMNPIQFFDDGIPGNEYSVFETLSGNVGILICYDLDYSYVARNIVKNGAEMLFVPTYDAMRWSELQHRQHSSMTSMRAVENGRFIARSASSGVSQIVDPSGRILNKIGIGISDIEIGSIERISKQTMYTKVGYLFPYLCILFAVLIIIYAILRPKP